MIKKFFCIFCILLFILPSFCYASSNVTIDGSVYTQDLDSSFKNLQDYGQLSIIYWANRYEYADDFTQYISNKYIPYISYVNKASKYITVNFYSPINSNYVYETYNSGIIQYGDWGSTPVVEIPLVARFYLYFETGAIASYTIPAERYNITSSY